jgi:hypothetical protein
MKNSKLMPGTRLFLCDECIGMEPRYLIVIFARQNGLGAVASYISKRRYRGEEIMAKELV